MAAVVGEQPNLLGLLEPDDDRSIAVRFERFIADNPHVYTLLVRLAREWVRRTGGRRVGIAALYERARWELGITTTESPKLDNSFRARFARKIMAENEDLAGLFEVRRSEADGSTS